MTTAEGNISSNDSDISLLQSRMTTAEGNISSNDSDISLLQSRMTTAEGNISSNDSDIATINNNLKNTTQRYRIERTASMNSSSRRLRLCQLKLPTTTANPISLNTHSTIRFKLSHQTTNTSGTVTYYCELDAKHLICRGFSVSGLTSTYGSSITDRPGPIYIIANRSVIDSNYETLNIFVELLNAGSTAYTRRFIMDFERDFDGLHGLTDIDISDLITEVSDLAGSSIISTYFSYCAAIKLDLTTLNLKTYSTIVSHERTSSSYRVFERNNKIIIDDRLQEPIGTIKMFYGSTSDIPRGWYICDGNNGTPDLRNKFIRGGDSSTVGDTGGSDTTDAITPTTTTNGSHNHTASVGSASSCWQSDTSGDAVGVANCNHNHTVSIGSNGNHNHNVTIPQHDNKPAFFTLYFIMKVYNHI
jgi:hypothetical protein